MLTHSPWLTVIVPSLNEAANIERTLSPLQPYRQWALEVILVDAGSTDDTVLQGSKLVDKVINSEAGRALQMNAGAKSAAESTEVMLFLHADTLLPEAFFAELCGFRRMNKSWGAFDVRLDDSRPIFRLVSFMISIRSYLSGICTGDQAIFLKKELWDYIGGYDAIPLMEDVALSKKLKNYDQYRIRQPVTTSSRRWKKHGVWKTILLMWTLRWRYYRGASADELARLYR